MEIDRIKQSGKTLSQKTVFGSRSFSKGLMASEMLNGPRKLSHARGITSKKEVGGKFLTEPSRKVPIVKEVDVLVVGGGMAGSCAAIAAGRMGLKTFLVEYFGYLGGNATNSSIDSFCGFYTFGKNTVPLVKGIGGEIVQTLVDRKGAQVEEIGGVAFDPEMLKIVLDEKIIEAKVERSFYTQMVAPIVEKNHMKGVIVENKGGRQAILSKIVLDCSGDGDVCALANVPFELGDGKGGFEACDMGFRLANVDKDFKHSIEKFAGLIEEALTSGHYKLTRTGFCWLGYTMVPGVWWANMARIPWAVNGVDPQHLTQSTIEGRKIVREFSRFLVNKQSCPFPWTTGTLTPPTNAPIILLRA